MGGDLHTHTIYVKICIDQVWESALDLKPDLHSLFFFFYYQIFISERSPSKCLLEINVAFMLAWLGLHQKAREFESGWVEAMSHVFILQMRKLRSAIVK